jgi:hypothetical protein
MSFGSSATFLHHEVWVELYVLHLVFLTGHATRHAIVKIASDARKPPATRGTSERKQHLPSSIYRSIYLLVYAIDGKIQ